jgi:DNA-binding IclR family transcriptional regulator
MGIVLELKRRVELENTSAGCVLTAELRRREEKRQREQIEEEEEERLLQAQVAETHARLQQVGPRQSSAIIEDREGIEIWTKIEITILPGMVFR